MLGSFRKSFVQKTTSDELHFEERRCQVDKGGWGIHSQGTSVCEKHVGTVGTGTQSHGQCGFSPNFGRVLLAQCEMSWRDGWGSDDQDIWVLC